MLFGGLLLFADVTSLACLENIHILPDFLCLCPTALKSGDKHISQNRSHLEKLYTTLFGDDTHRSSSLTWILSLLLTLNPLKITASSDSRVVQREAFLCTPHQARKVDSVYVRALRLKIIYYET